MYPRYVKPLLDFGIAFILLILLCPLLLIGMLIAALSAKGNPFFIHPRPGLHEQTINVLKLKTMKPEIDPSGRILGNVERITVFGNFLRITSIDEIPQLINVLKGDLSLVGPRPLQMWYLPYYNDYQRRRHTVRPGITGLAQIKGRNQLTWDEKFDLDIRYVENVSLLLDLKILLLTPLKLMSVGEVNSGGSNTMEAFVKNPIHEQHDVEVQLNENNANKKDYEP
jgi:lipopolysaccharide/colanic/teichoic acid biosynthesis glycosyltransferase